MTTRTIVTAFICAALAAAPEAHAQVACEKGYRDTTAAERDAMTSVLERAKAALPQAPDGWMIGGYEEPNPIGRICIDAEGSPWSYGISRTYNRADDVAEREQLQAEAGAALSASAAQRQPRMDELMQRMQQLGLELGTAAQKGDQARIDAINQELEALQQQMESVLSDAPSAAQTEALGALLYQDREMSIAVAINSGSVSHPDLQSVQAPAGAHSALRGETTREGIVTATAVVLFGNWRPMAGGGMQSVPRPSVASTAAHTLVVTVTADPARLDSLIGTIELGMLAGLVR